MQSNLQNESKKLHVAIIMDGNGRWATRQGLPRSFGHKAGAEAVRHIFRYAEELGVGTLTLFGMSSDNFSRPQAEVDTMMDIFTTFLLKETPNLVAHHTRLCVIGSRERLPQKLLDAIDYAESATSNGTGIHMRIAIDYSARDQILHAAERLRNIQRPDCAAFMHALTGDEAFPDVDLLIRTSGEQRLSDFLLWESAYAELWFTPLMWPEFGPDDLKTAIEHFYSRERRFGKIGLVDALPDNRPSLSA